MAQSVAIGLAAAFLVILAKPELVNLGVRVGVPSTSYASAVDASAPAVVSLQTAQLGQRSRFTTGITSQGLGSGVIISQDGYLATNWHVIRDADRVVVQLADGRVAEPEFVGADPDTDLALLKIDLPDLPSIGLGRSDTLEIGEIVLAIGNPYGLSQTVTLGIISATGRGLGLTNFENFIQTDAAINIGNSGGALVNARGELIGINTARFSSNQGVPDGIGFAIPVNLVRGVIAELIENGRVVRGWLGELPSRVCRSHWPRGGIATDQRTSRSRRFTTQRHHYPYQRRTCLKSKSGYESRGGSSSWANNSNPRIQAWVRSI